MRRLVYLVGDLFRATAAASATASCVLPVGAPLAGRAPVTRLSGTRPRSGPAVKVAAGFLRPAPCSVGFSACGAAPLSCLSCTRYAQGQARVPAAPAAPGRSYSVSPVLRAPKADISELVPMEKIRNIAIIAHVDHGKTTLVDALLRQSSTKLDDCTKEESQLMDHNVLEKERGITILSKVTSIMYNDYRFNIVDTPGHADFGGEVERVLTMVDGVILVVDAVDGPMAQTKYVLSKALSRNLRPVVVLNKADRPNLRLNTLDSQLFDLFVDLGADDALLEYPTIYSSAKEEWATDNWEEGQRTSMKPLFDAIVKHVPPPLGSREGQFKMLVTQLEANPYFGKCYIGRVFSGIIRAGDPIKAIDREGKLVETHKATKMFLKAGLDSITTEIAGAGDIITIAGLTNSTVNHTICDPSVNDPLPSDPVDPPTVSMVFGPNTSPLAGTEGTKLSSNDIRERLIKEAETNVALKILASNDRTDVLEVMGRGELQLGILIETMRREGYEMTISPPKVLIVDGKEPIEELRVECNSDIAGAVIQAMIQRKGEMKDMSETDEGRAKMVFEVPTRGLIGYPAEFLHITAGEGVLTRAFARYDTMRPGVNRGRKPAMVAMSTGTTTTYALQYVEEKGKLFVKPGDKVYPGMIVGEYNKESAYDIEVSCCKTRPGVTVRAGAKDTPIRLHTAQLMSMEDCMAYVEPDECIEITPKAIRMRKTVLDANLRRATVKKQKAMEAKA